jgi:hypothetical protein
VKKAVKESFVPPLRKWYFTKLERRPGSNEAAKKRSSP